MCRVLFWACHKYIDGKTEQWKQQPKKRRQNIGSKIEKGEQHKNNKLMQHFLKRSRSEYNIYFIKYKNRDHRALYPVMKI